MNTFGLDVISMAFAAEVAQIENVDKRAIFASFVCRVLEKFAPGFDPQAFWRLCHEL